MKDFFYKTWPNLFYLQFLKTTLASFNHNLTLKISNLWFGLRSKPILYSFHSVPCTNVCINFLKINLSKETYEGKIIPWILVFCENFPTLFPVPNGIFR